MTSNFFLVWNPNGPRGGFPTHMHDSLHSARLEAERLARQHPGEDFHVLASVGTARKVDVDWVPHVDDLPF